MVSTTTCGRSSRRSGRVGKPWSPGLGQLIEPPPDELRDEVGADDAEQVRPLVSSARSFAT